MSGYLKIKYLNSRHLLVLEKVRATWWLEAAFQQHISAIIVCNPKDSIVNVFNSKHQTICKVMPTGS